jgi:hypothetical protein
MAHNNALVNDFMNGVTVLSPTSNRVTFSSAFPTLGTSPFFSSTQANNNAGAVENNATSLLYPPVDNTLANQKNVVMGNGKKVEKMYDPVDYIYAIRFLSNKKLRERLGFVFFFLHFSKYLFY